MVNRFALVTLAAALAFCPAAMALEVTKSVDAPEPPAVAWKAIGDFCGIANWHPAVAKCEPSTKDGATMRLLTLKDGAKNFGEVAVIRRSGHGVLLLHH